MENISVSQRDRRADFLEHGAVGESESVRGRISRLRVSSGAAFADVLHEGRLLQIGAVRSREVEGYEFLSASSCGDFIEVSGRWGQSRSGDVVLFCSSSVRLAACGIPFPSWAEPPSEESARQRPDLARACDPERQRHQLARFMVLSEVERRLNREGFRRFPVPVLSSVASGAMARPFASRSDALDQDLFLRVALENELVRLVASGFDSIYDAGPVFRNEGVSGRHHPEFWLAEAYRIGMSWREALHVCIGIVEEALVSQGREPIGDVPVWNIEEAWSMFGGEMSAFHSPERQFDDLRRAGFSPDPSIEARRWQYLDELLSPPRSCFALVGHPVAISPLARFEPEMSGCARFELYLDGFEIANGYEQERDPVEQRRRFEEQAERAGSQEAMGADQNYLEMLSMGLPPIGGFGIGLDRLAWLVSGAESIRSVLAFPLRGS